MRCAISIAVIAHHTCTDIDTDKLRCGSLQLNPRPFQSIPALRAKD